jgi:YfiH family protein
MIGNVILHPDWPAPPRVKAAVTTRPGGVSQIPYDSLNLGDHVGDDPAAVSINRGLLRELIPELPSEPRWLAQTHGTRCVRAETIQAPAEADAAVTNASNTVCAVLTADCLPVLLCDRAGTVVGVAHAGWRGLLSGVLENTVATMERPGAQLLAWLGPAIGPAAFEVGDEVRSAFLSRDPAAADAFRAGVDGKWWCDLYLLARQRLISLGVEGVTGGGLCTYGDRTHFYSFRRDGVTGRMASLIWLEPGPHSV